MSEKKKNQNKRTDWGNECGRALGITGKVLLKVVSYFFNILLTLLLIGLITGTVVGSVFIYYVKNYIDTDMEEFENLGKSTTRTTTIYYMDWEDRSARIGTMVELEDQRLYGGRNSIWVPYSQIPKNLVNAFVAIEDHRFWDHGGVDFITTVKSALKYFTGNPSGGGSTITQQLIKNVTGDDEVTMQRKIQEIMRALDLENTKDKTEIMEMYLNVLYLSQGCYGVQSAAYKYFGKDVSELSLVECAALASITQAPTKWDPIQNPENNKKRRNVVLDQMLEYGYITQEECEAAKKEELVLKEGQAESTVKTNINSWYTDAAIEQAIDLLMESKGYSYAVAEKMIYNSGLQIITAMDPEIQSIMEDFYEDDSNFPSVDDSPIQPESSMVIIDPYTGDVLGLVGGRGEKTANRILNYATETTRSPGSSIKPLSVYGPALEYGLISYTSVFDDAPVNFGVYNASTGTYSNKHGWPANLPDRYGGLTSVYDALQRSVNTISIRILTELTTERSFDYVKNKLHMDSFIEAYTKADGETLTDKDFAALGLGQMNYGVTVLEMTAAYQIFPNGGIYNKPRIVLEIRDSDGKTLVENTSESSIVMSEQNASIMTRMMQNVVESPSGTAYKAVQLKSSVNCAGKTGTTSSDNDRWYMGYTPYYVGGVWFGYSMPSSLDGFSATVPPAAQIWDAVMTQVHQSIFKETAAAGETVKSFSLAEGVVQATVCRDSGKLMTAACKADPRGSRAVTGYYTTSTVPTDYCDCHVLVNYDKVTKAIACEDCPEQNIIQVGLISVVRDFPLPVKITDAEYTYRDLGGKEPGGEAYQPYYAPLLGSGHYSGYSGGSTTTQYNHLCKTHYISPEDRVTETTSPETTDPPPDTAAVTDPPDTDPPVTTEPQESEPVSGNEPE